MKVRKEGFQVYVTCEAKENAYFMNMEYPLIKQNQLRSFLPWKIMEQDETKTLYYEVTGKISLLEWGEKQGINYEISISILRSFLTLFQELEEYMLSPSQVCFQKENIYIDVDHTLSWIYGDVVREDMTKEVEALFFWMMSIVDYQDKRCMDLMYQTYYGVRNQGLSKEFLLQCLGEQEEQTIQTEWEAEEEHPVMQQELLRESSWQEQKIEPEEESKEKNIERRRKQGGILSMKRILSCIHIGHILLMVLLLGDGAMIGYLGWNIYGRGLNPKVALFFIGSCLLFVLFLILLWYWFPDISEKEQEEQRMEAAQDYWQGSKESKKSEEKMSVFEELEGYWGQGNETVLLRENVDSITLLLQEEAGTQEIEVKVFPFYIGSMNGLNQLSLKSKAVSRQHAVLLRDKGDDVFYIEDLESKNGTTLNGLPLAAGIKSRLEDGNRVVFGDEAWKILIKTR